MIEEQDQPTPLRNLTRYLCQQTRRLRRKIGRLLKLVDQTVRIASYSVHPEKRLSPQDRLSDLSQFQRNSAIFSRSVLSRATLERDRHLVRLGWTATLDWA